MAAVDAELICLIKIKGSGRRRVDKTAKLAGSFSPEIQTVHSGLPPDNAPKSREKRAIGSFDPPIAHAIVSRIDSFARFIAQVSPRDWNREHA